MVASFGLVVRLVGARWLAEDAFYWSHPLAKKKGRRYFCVFIDENHQSSQSSEVVSFFSFVLELEDSPADQSPIVLALRVLQE